MAISGIKMEGWNEFIEAVKRVPNEMKPKAMRGIIAKNMKPIAQAIKAAAPVRDQKHYQGVITRKRASGDISTESSPGNLKKSIGVRTFGKGGYVAGYAGIQKRKNDGWYGFFLERGTKKMGKDPFIARSSAGAIPQAADRLGQDVKEYIVKNAKKLGLDAK
jgi:HK97 gp10 family phage protein